MNKTKIIVCVILMSIGTVIALLNKPNSEEMSADNFFMENIEALAALENIGGKWVIIDEIPCSSSASELRWDKSYVNCTDCKEQKGKADGEPGKCTVVRPIN